MLSFDSCMAFANRYKNAKKCFCQNVGCKNWIYLKKQKKNGKLWENLHFFCRRLSDADFAREMRRWNEGRQEDGLEDRFFIANGRRGFFLKGIEGISCST